MTKPVSHPPLVNSLPSGKNIVIRPKHMRDDLTRRNLMIKDTMLTRIGNGCDEKSTKFIGILFDENLTWRDHVSHVNKKISRALFSIKQVINTLPVKCLRTLYYYIPLYNCHTSSWDAIVPYNRLLHACLLHARLLHGCDVTHISSIFATSISLC